MVAEQTKLNASSSLRVVAEFIEAFSKATSHKVASFVNFNGLSTAPNLKQLIMFTV